MKKAIKLCAYYLTVILILSSCSKSESSNNNPSSDPFTSTSVSQQQKDITTAGQNVANGLVGMESSNGVSAIEYFSNLGGVAAKSAVFLRPFNLATHNNGNTNVLLKALTDNDTTLALIFDALKATYTWNANSQSWDTTGNSSSVEFIYPASENATTNNAKLVISYTSAPGNFNVSGYDGNLPATFSITLSVNGSVVAELSYAASYNSDGFPTTLNSFIELTPYKMGETWTYSNTGVSGSYYFMDGSNYLFEFKGNTTGNYSKTNVDTASELSSVLKTANFSYQVGNLELAGNVNYSNINDSLSYFRANTDAAATSLANLYNRNSYLTLFYVSSNQKIANSKFVVISSTNYDDNDNGTNYNVQLEYIFNNGEPTSLNSYFNQGSFASLDSTFNNVSTTSNK